MVKGYHGKSFLKELTNKKIPYDVDSLGLLHIFNINKNQRGYKGILIKLLWNKCLFIKIKIQ